MSKENLSLRYLKTVQQAKTKLRKMKRVSRKSKEIELAWLMREVEQYGVHFPMADHYVSDAIEKIEKLV